MLIRRGRIEGGMWKCGVALAVAVLLAGCVTPTVVQSVQPGDPQLSCQQLHSEIAEAEKLRIAAEGKRTTGGSSALKFILLFPGWALDRENIDTAVKAADARKSHLDGLIKQKNCPPPKAPAKPGAK